MSSLKKCLTKIGLEAHEQAIINGTVEDYRAEGYEAHQAAVEAVKDYIAQLKDERKDIEGQIKEKAPAATPAEINTVADIKAKYEAQGVDLYIIEDKHPFARGGITLMSLIVPKGARRRGIGSNVMRDITELADKTGRYVYLTPGTKDDFHGTTSRGRLVKFYKHFGFVENKGRRKDFTINESMYRAPNRFDTKRQTDSPSFKSWFKKSKVVDANGEPLVVYHGTDVSKNFDVFSTQFGAHFGSASQANARIGVSPEMVKNIAEQGGPATYQERRRLIPVFLSIQNPLRHKDVGGSWADIIEDAKAKGYDGIVYKNEFEDRGRGGDSWIAFNPTQIKSAVGNTGKFSPGKKSILASMKDRPYANVPDELMGFGKPDKQKGFDETKYPAELNVTVKYPEGDEWVDAIKGMNYEHALERARRNWPGAEITPGELVRAQPLRASVKTETKAFRDWFGKSKVVDANGDPMVVYHGTYSEFDRFKRRVGDIGMHFGTAAAASDRIADDVPHRRVTGGARVLPVYLRITNPLRLEDAGFWNAENLNWKLKELFPEDASKFGTGVRGTKGITTTKELREFIQSKGYDGIVYRNTGEVAGAEPFRKKVEAARAVMESAFPKSKNSFSVEDQKRPEYIAWSKAQEEYKAHREASTEDSWIAFDPVQVKSAIGNRGTFSRTNADITASIKKHKAQIDTKEFKRWFEKSEIVDDAGKPLVVFHGSTHDFKSFSDSYGNAGNFLGKGFYFSSSVDDVNANYAGFGPDITGRIEIEKDRYQDLDDDQARELLSDYFWGNPEILGDVDIDELLENETEFDQLKEKYLGDAISLAARRAVAGGHEGAIYPAFLKMEKPFYLDDISLLGKSYTPIGIEVEYSEDGEEVVEERGEGVKLIEAMRDNLRYYGISEKEANGVIDNLYEKMMDGSEINGGDILSAMGELYLVDDEGDSISSGAVLKDVIKDMGYDGIVMDAERHFGPRRGIMGVRLPGMANVAGAVHFMPFEPTQIKSSIGNIGTFDPAKTDITASIKMNPESELQIPEFIGTNDAIEFGRVATIDQIDEMRRLYILLNDRAKKLMMAPELEALEQAMTQAYRAQFLHEAVLAAEGHADEMVAKGESLSKLPPTKLDEPTFSIKKGGKSKQLEFTDLEPQKIPGVKLEKKFRVRMQTTGSIAAAGNVVTNVQDAASLLAPIRKAAQENAFIVMVGEDGTVIEIHRYGKGTKNAAYVDPIEVVGRAGNTPGVTAIYFAHNHPSANPTPSREDMVLASRISVLAAADRLKAYAMVIGGTKFVDISMDADKTLASQSIRPTVRKLTIPVKERYLATASGPVTNLSNSDDVNKWVAANHPKQAGIILVDNKNNIAGWLNSLGHLTPLRAFAEIVKALEMTNSNGIIFVSPAMLSPETKVFIGRVGRALSGDNRLLDTIENGVSLATTGAMNQFAGPVQDPAVAIGMMADEVRSLKDLKAKFSLRRRDINRAFERGMMSPEDIAIGNDLDALAVLDRALGLGGSGRPPQHWQNIDAQLDANPYMVKKIRQIERRAGVKILDRQGHILKDPMEARTRLDVGESKFNKKGDVVPRFKGFYRSFAQTYLDAMFKSDKDSRESFRRAIVRSIEEAYGDPSIAVKGELNLTFENMASKKDYAIGRPLRKADKTMAALNLNTMCPMMTLGVHGCYIDGCYVVGLAQAGQIVNYYSSAMYTAEILQMRDKDVTRLNAAGGLRINGMGDTSMDDLGQWADIFRHAEMRGLKLKIITKQDATMEVVDRIRKSKKIGSTLAANTVIQTSMDPYWVEVSQLDDVPGSAMRQSGVIEKISAGDLKGAVDTIKKEFHRDAKVVNGKVFRKYGYSWEQLKGLSKKYPKLKFLPRVVVATPREIAEYALRMPEVLQTWMHAKLRPGMWSDIEGAPITDANALNFKFQIAVRKVDGEWRILRQKDKASLEAGESEPYTAVEQYIKANYKPADQEKIFTTLSYQLRKDPSSLCCAISASQDACATCQSTCAHGSYHTGTDFSELTQRGIDDIGKGIKSIGRTPDITASLRRSSPLAGKKTRDDLFYSVMEDTIRQKKLSGPAANVLESINAWARKGDIKEEEVNWSGVREWLQDKKGKITTKDLLQYLKKNNVRVIEIEKTLRGQDLVGYDVHSEIDEDGERTARIDWRKSDPYTVDGVYLGDYDPDAIEKDYPGKLNPAEINMLRWIQETAEELTSPGDDEFSPGLWFGERSTEGAIEKLIEDNAVVYEARLPNGVYRAFPVRTENETEVGYQLERENPDGSVDALGSFDTWEYATREVEDNLDTIIERYGGQTKYHNYMQGGENASRTADDMNYKELLLVVANPRLNEDSYDKGHWSEENVVVHIRITERMAPSKKFMSVRFTEGARPWKIFVEGEEQHHSSYATFQEADAFLAQYPVFQDKARELFIEEIQSDWHQEARRRKYRSDLKIERVKIADMEGLKTDLRKYTYDDPGPPKVVEADDADSADFIDFTIPGLTRPRVVGMIKKWSTGVGRNQYGWEVRISKDPNERLWHELDHRIYPALTGDEHGGEGFENYYNTVDDAIAAAKHFKIIKSGDKMETATFEIDGGRIRSLHKSISVPDAPFRATWPLLAIKRMIKYAAENGYDSISWSTGHLQFKQWGSERFYWDHINIPGDYSIYPSTDAAAEAYLNGEMVAFHEFEFDGQRESFEQVVHQNMLDPDSWDYARKVDKGRARHVPRGEWIRAYIGVGGYPEDRIGWVFNGREQWQGDVFANQEERLENEMYKAGIFIRESDGEKVNRKELRENIEKVMERERSQYNPDKWEKHIDKIRDRIWSMMQERGHGRYLPRYKGMEGFYDERLVNDVNNFFGKKTWGSAKVTSKTLVFEVDEDEGANVHTLEITPEMKAKALEKGMPLFSLRRIRPPGKSYLEAVNSVLGAPTVSTDEDTAADPFGGLDPEIKKALGDSKGIVPASFRQRLKQNVKDIWYSVSRHRPYLDPADDGQITDILRVHQDTGENAVRRAMQILEKILAGLKPKQYQVFTMSLVMDDMIKDRESGLLDDPENLPFGFTEEKARAYRDYLAGLVAADPAIAAALKRRQIFQDKLRKALVEADLLHEDVLSDPRYFHHQVLQYRAYKEDQENYQGIGVKSQDVRMQRKGWQKGRIGSIAEYNTDYAESEFEVISQGLAQLETMHTMNQIKDRADITPRLSEEAKLANYVAIVGGQENYDRLLDLRGEKAEIQANKPLDSGDKARLKQINEEIWALDPTMPFRAKIAQGYARLAKALGIEVDEGIEDGDLGMKEINAFAKSDNEAESLPARMILKAISDRRQFVSETLGKNFKTAKSLMPTGYAAWMPSKGQSWYKAFTITDRLVAAINEGEATLGQENADKIKTVLAKAKNPEWIIPVGLAKTLDGYDMKYEDHWMSKRSRELMSGWKSWTLLSPPRVLKYNINNMSGDLDIVFAYRPEIFYKYFWKAFADLSKEGDLFLQKNKDMSEALRGEIELAYSLGVLGSGWSVQEVSEVAGQLAMKQRLDAMTGNDPSLIERYWENTKKYTQFRENLLRLAAFRYFRDQLEAGKNVYGASNQAEIDGIVENDRKAAKLARELLGDYGNITHAGLWMRAHTMPFYSWMEVNAPRYVRLMRNLPHEEGSGTLGAARIVTAGAAKVAGAAAVKSLPLLMKMAGFWVLASLWNKLRYPEEEAELGEQQRAQMHLILGRRADGSIITMRVQGAFSDALSWFGLETAVADVTKMIAGKKSISDQAKDMLLATPKKLIGAVRPDVKAFAELLSGKSFYPDPFHPRTIRDRVEYIARTFSLGGLYNWAMGRPKRGDGIYKQMFNDLQGLLTYTSDPGEMAYYDVTRIVSDYKQDAGPDPKDKADAMYYYKQALKFGDLKAAAKYLQQYRDLGGTDKSEIGAIKRAHPLGQIAKKDQAKFRETLSEEELYRLQLAEEWYNRTYRGETREAAKAMINQEPPEEEDAGMTLREGIKLLK